MTRTIHLRYFAVLKEERGLTEETFVTELENPLAIFEKLNSEFHFSIDQTKCRVAINDEFVPWDQKLCDGDQVVFIPPVSGG
jgi:molybdopterin converting factor small subunit